MNGIFFFALCMHRSPQRERENEWD